MTRQIFERLCLEAFQSGLSWLTILRKRENFRKAFAGFDIPAVAAFTDADVARLLADAGIVQQPRQDQRRHHQCPCGRRAHRRPQRPGVGLRRRRRPRPAPRHLSPTSRRNHAELKALAKELRKRGFAFTGPVTVYAAMQACGLVNDHLEACFARAA